MSLSNQHMFSYPIEIVAEQPVDAGIATLWRIPVGRRLAFIAYLRQGNFITRMHHIQRLPGETAPIDLGRLHGQRVIWHPSSLLPQS